MAKKSPASRKTSKPATLRTLDAFPDRIDIRDWMYQPTLTGLPDTLVTQKRVVGNPIKRLS